MMDNHGGSEASNLSLEDLIDEYSSRPPQIAEWLWCIEYVAKFVKDFRCILALMNMGYQYSNDHGKRINEILSLRILEFMFDPSKNDSTGDDFASTSEPRVEFDLSLSNTDVLREILKAIQVSELRAGMPELSKFNVLPFIVHKNMYLPQCALEKLRDLSSMENQTSAASSMEANDPVVRDERSVHMDTCDEQINEQQVPICLDQNRNENDNLTVIDDEDEPIHTKKKYEVIVINEDTENNQDTADEPISNGNTTLATFPSTSRRWPEDARVKCAKDGTWLISGSDDDNDSDMIKGPALAKMNTRPGNICWKCGKEGTLLICSRSECASKVHKECLNCVVNVDENGIFHCPVCSYDRFVSEVVESRNLMSSAKRRLVKFMPRFSTRSKRLR